MNLRPYQTDISNRGAAIVHERGLVYLAMETRTGKTFTALTIAHLCGARNVLFITKLKIKPSIETDYKACGYGFRMTCTNYEQVHNMPRDFDFVIIDEAHSLSAFPKPSLRALRIKAAYFQLPMVFLSGTPTPESYSGIYHQLWVSARSPFKTYNNFYLWALSFVNKKMDIINGHSVINYDDANREAINAHIAPLMLHYTQQEAGFNCPVNEHFVIVDDPQLPALTRQLFKDRRLTFDQGEVIADTPAKLMGKMHQLSSGTCILDNDSRIIISRMKAEEIKRQFVGKRIAIFYKFILEFNVLREAFGEAVTESAEEFQANPDRVFLSQIQSGREGIALHFADALIYYSIDYSAVSYWQSRARIQALNRDTAANIYWVFTKGGIEPKIYKAVSSKKDFTLSWFMRHGGI